MVESVCVSHAWCMYVPITHQYTSLHRLPSLSCPPCFLYHPYITHPTIRIIFSFTSTSTDTMNSTKVQNPRCLFCTHHEALQALSVTHAQWRIQGVSLVSAETPFRPCRAADDRHIAHARISKKLSWVGL